MLLRNSDPDLYLLSLFASSDEARKRLWALFAFYHDIERVRLAVTDTHMGLIRLQWWRETLEAAKTDPGPARAGRYGEIARALALYGNADDFAENAGLYERLLVAREFDLEDTPPADEEGLGLYLKENTAPLLALASGEKEEAMADGLARAFGFIRMVRAVPLRARAGACLLPRSVMEESGLTQEIYGSARYSNELSLCLKNLKKYYDIPKEKMNSGLLQKCAAMTDLQARRLARFGWNPYDPRARTAPFLAARLALFH